MDESISKKSIKLPQLPRPLLIAAAVLSALLLLVLVFLLYRPASEESSFPLYTEQELVNAGGSSFIRSQFDSGGKLLSRRVKGYDWQNRLVSLKAVDAQGKVSLCYELSYNDAGLISEKRNYSPEGSLFQSCVYEYNDKGLLLGKSFYDAYGNLTQYIRYTPNGKALYWEIYEYNPQHKPLKQSRYTAERKLDYWYEREYNDQGLQLSYSRYKADGSRENWTEYSYDEMNRLVCKKQYDREGELNIQTDHEYLDDGGFSTWTWFYQYDGSTSREHSVYDKNGNRTYYGAYPNTWDLAHGNSSSYDENGNLIYYEEFGLWGWVIKWYNYEYDAEGRELRRMSQGVYERKSWYENIYDDKGNCTERIYYDELGNITKRVQDPPPEMSFRYIYRPDY